MHLVVMEGFFLYLCYYKHNSTKRFMFIVVFLFPLYLLRTRSPESKPKQKLSDLLLSDTSHSLLLLGF